MPLIITQHNGVLTQAQTISVVTNEVVESYLQYIAQSETHKSYLDGFYRLSSEELLRMTEDAAEVACEINQNMQAFLKHASETMVCTDDAGAMVFAQGGVSSA